MTRTLLIAFVALAALAIVSGSAVAGPYIDATHGINYNDPRFVGWATGITVHLPNGFTPFYSDTSKALGAAPATSNDVTTLGDGGWAVLTFGVTIRNHAGPDLAVFENGFNDPVHPSQLFGELAFVEVSSDGTSYARFPSVSLNSWPGEYGSLEPTNVYNLAGKNINNNDQAWQGTPFDLSDLANDALVKSGAVDLSNIHYVKIIDINGDSNGVAYDSATSLIDPTTGLNYSSNHVIYDGGNNGGNLAGFDLDAVGVLVQTPEPGSVSLAVIGTLALVEWARRRRKQIA